MRDDQDEGAPVITCLWRELPSWLKPFLLNVSQTVCSVFRCAKEAREKRQQPKKDPNFSIITY